MLDPHKSKFHALYWDMAIAASQSSVSRIAKVGSVVVTSAGMISVGWNGMPPGMDNDCEYYDEESSCWRSKREVIHSEINALDKMAKQGVTADGSIIFSTRAPCIRCAKSILTRGIKAVYYLEPHKNDEGVNLLKRVGIYVEYQGDKYPDFYEWEL